MDPLEAQILGSLHNKRKKGLEEDVAKMTLAKKNSIMKLLNYKIFLKIITFFTIVKTLGIFVYYMDHNKHKTKRRVEL